MTNRDFRLVLAACLLRASMPWALFLLLLLSLLAAPAASQVLLGSGYDALYFDSRDRRLEQYPKFRDTGFGLMSSAFTPADAAPGGILAKCQADGLKVLYQTNTGSIDEHAKIWQQYPCVYAWYASDDTDLVPGNTPAKVKAAITAMQPRLRPGMLSFTTFSKQAKPEVWANVSDIQALQLYVWKEGTLRKWYWDYVKAWRAAHTGKLWVHPYLGRNAIPYSLRNDPVWREQEYTPVAWNEAAIWAALCAGADDMLFYSAYTINSTFPPDYGNVLERWDLLPAYKAMLGRIRFYERFFAGSRTTFEEPPNVVGARWTLPSGETLTVRVDTFEQLPRVDWAITMPTRNAIIKQTETGLTIEYRP